MDLDIVETEPAKGVSNDYLRINQLGKIPTFVGEDGYELTESIAIAIYSKPISHLVPPSKAFRLMYSITMMRYIIKTVIPV